jgi:CII-binding regulator of phage lambda lysogenization HflD
VIAGTLEIQLQAQMARLSQDMRQAQSTVGNAMAGINSAVATTMRALGALGIGISVLGFTRLISNSLKAQDELSKLSQKTAIAVETLAGLKHVSDQTGVGFDGLQKGLKTITTQMFDAAGGSIEMQRNFKLLRLDVREVDGQLKSSEKMMLEVADRFAGMADGAEKSALAVKLFGRAGLDMIPMLNMGSEKIAMMIAEGQRLNPVTAESARMAELFNDNMDVLSKSIGTVAIQLVVDLVPAFAKASEAMVKAQRDGDSFFRMLIKGWRELITGDDAHKWNVQMAKAGDALVEAQNAMDRAYLEHRRRPSAWTNLAVTDAKQAFDRAQSEMNRLLAIKPYMAPDVAPKPTPTGTTPPRITATSTGDPDSTYRSMIKSLREKLLLDHEQTEVMRLQMQLESMNAKARASITPAREKELRDLATEIDRRKQLAGEMENEAKNYAALEKARQEGAEMEAEYARRKGETLIAAYEGVRQIEFEIELIGKSNAEREVAIALRELENKGIRQGTEEYARLAERMRTAINMRAVRTEALAEWKQFWSSAEQTGKTVFTNIFSQGKSAFEGIGQAIKASVIDVLYQLTVRQWIINIGANIGGMMGVPGGGMAQAGGSLLGGAFGGPGSMVSSVGNLVSGGVSSIFGASNFTAALAGDAFLPAALGATGSGAVGAGSAIGGAMAGIGSALPWIGGALAIGSMFGLFDGGGPKASDIGLYAGGAYGVNFGQNNVTDTGWGEAFASEMQHALTAMGPKGREFMASQAGRSWQASGPESAQNMVNQYVKPLLEHAKQLDATQKAAEEAADAAAEALKQMRREVLLARDALGFWKGEVATLAAELGTNNLSVEGVLNDFLAQLDAGIGVDTANKWQRLLQAVQALTQEEEKLVAAQHQSFQAAVAMKDSILQSLRQFQEGLEGSQYLSPLERMAGTRRIFESTLAAARAGDSEASLRYGDVANQYLAASRDVYASSPQFQEVFRQVAAGAASLSTQNQMQLNTLLRETPASIQSGFADQIKTLREGFTSVVDALNRLSSGMRQAGVVS